MGFIRFILFLILAGIIIRLIQFLILYFSVRYNIRKNFREKQEGQTRIHHVPRHKNSKNDKGNDEYVNFEEINEQN